ncbi:MAG TPA: glycosyltransferase family A protein, partial [Bacteroidales bacterium]|nr:glycosyltransferase family A protein [Bacteroidales bacterium]
LNKLNGPLISVVIPLYNKENYIERTMRSVIGQTFKDLEIIVIDDGSKDNSANIVKSIKDDRIKLLHINNQGEGVARNTGIKNSGGEIIAFLDADDEWMPGFLDEILILKNEFPNAGMFATGFRNKYYGNYSIDTFISSKQKKKTHIHINNYFKLALQRGIITASNVGILKKIFFDVGFFCEKIGSGCDRDMWAKVALKYDVVFSNKILAVYHCQHSMGRNSNTKQEIPVKPIISETINNFINNKEHNPFDKYLKEYLNLNWFDRVDMAIKNNHGHEVKRILSEEIKITQNSIFKFLWLKILVTIFPLEWIKLIRRFQKSRWCKPIYSFFKNKPYPRVIQRGYFENIKNKEI